MRFWDEVDEAIKKVRQGQEATCPLCKKGKLIPVGNPKTTKSFYCDTCKEKLNLD